MMSQSSRSAIVAAAAGNISGLLGAGKLYPPLFLPEFSPRSHGPWGATTQAGGAFLSESMTSPLCQHGS